GGREQRRQAEAAFEAARQMFDVIVPPGERAGGDAEAGLVALRARRSALADDLAAGLSALGLAAIPEDPPGSSDDVDATERAAQSTLDQVNADVAQAELEARLSAERLEQATQGHLRAREEADRLQAEESAAVTADPDEALVRRHEEAEQAIGALVRERERLQHARPAEGLPFMEAAVDRLSRQIDEGRSERERLRTEIAQLQGTIRGVEGEGLDEKIAEAAREADGFDRECAYYEREGAILDRLHQALVDAEREATEKYLAPLQAILRPALQALFPRALLSLDPQFGPLSLDRGQTEQVADLSDGTREQIAVLVRLGFAELMLAQGRPALLVLDDALTFSDSGRLERMFDIFGAVAARMQIIVLTCRGEMFAGLGARRLTIDAAARLD
ncbi:ATP-binding protein, partial [Ameyamaea chiangmaiensis]|nr:hypothetical protein [Ameyamaea chiangmaiensis]